MRLYDRHNIDELRWPETANGQYAKQYLMPLIKGDTAHAISNAKTKVYVLAAGDEHILPITVNEAEYGNSYVCSPYTHYVSYAREELQLLGSRAARGALSLLLYGVGAFLRSTQINRTVHVNNWLLSTNLYPQLNRAQATAILQFLQQQFPKHSIVFRSLNETTTRELLDRLRQQNCRMVPSRQIYLHHPHKADAMNAKARWLLKRDYALIEKNGYQVVEPEQFSEEDLPRVLELYNDLYLRKYSLYNPQFQLPFIRLAWQEQTLHLYGLRKNGKIDAVLGYFSRDGVMTTPLFGYDLSMPQQLGLYRMLSALLMQLAAANGQLLHESSGAAQFKRNRGAVAEIEYSAVYDRHLPFYRRSGWILLENLIGKIGVPIIRKLKL
ncbi:GNAT family N-acetyltransferase [Paenibacillus sp. GCM10027626]|uniref:GNAT family N-acetyltransferase n=1 Tax=Paenibacillus sp. GCM10027626 TaxID=3273411 RepID=UPI003640BF30